MENTFYADDHRLTFHLGYEIELLRNTFTFFTFNIIPSLSLAFTHISGMVQFNID